MSEPGIFYTPLPLSRGEFLKNLTALPLKENLTALLLRGDTVIEPAKKMKGVCFGWGTDTPCLLSGLSNIFLYAGKDRFDNFSKVVKS